MRVLGPVGGGAGWGGRRGVELAGRCWARGGELQEGMGSRGLVWQYRTLFALRSVCEVAEAISAVGGTGASRLAAAG